MVSTLAKAGMTGRETGVAVAPPASTEIPGFCIVGSGSGVFGALGFETRFLFSPWL